mmetsp:Transcript_11928/g.16974  ORF Transcript_11928/g.16974 Transcript_11928/m.16974 type:complete len:260 (+) Transcript_11928:218-997(+)
MEYSCHKDSPNPDTAPSGPDSYPPHTSKHNTFMYTKKATNKMPYPDIYLYPPTNDNYWNKPFKPLHTPRTPSANYPPPLHPKYTVTPISNGHSSSNSSVESHANSQMECAYAVTSTSVSWVIPVSPNPNSSSTSPPLHHVESTPPERDPPESVSPPPSPRIPPPAKWHWRVEPSYSPISASVPLTNSIKWTNPIEPPFMRSWNSRPSVLPRLASLPPSMPVRLFWPRPILFTEDTILESPCPKMLICPIPFSVALISCF